MGKPKRFDQAELVNQSSQVHVPSAADLSLLTPRLGAERAIAEVVAKHPEVGNPAGGLTEGPDGIFFQDFGSRAVYHHQLHGTWLLYGEILNAYRYLQDYRFTLGPPVGTEENGPAVRDAELGRMLDPRQVRFTEGVISWTDERGISFWRPQNSRCSVRWEFDIVQQRSRKDFHDNDWLSMVWLADGQQITKTVPLRAVPDDSTEIHGEQDKSEGHTPIKPFEDYVVCNRHDPISVAYTVLNLNGGTFDDQLRVASEFTQRIAKIVAPVYLDTAAAVLAVVATGGLGAVPVIVGLAAGGVSGGITLLHDPLSKLTGQVMDAGGDWLTEQLSGVLIDLGLSKANCSGPLLSDYVVFDSAESLDQKLSKTYSGLAVRHGCQSPITTVHVQMRRTVDKAPLAITTRPGKSG